MINIDTPAHMGVCDICGALVHDEELHHDWHDQIADTIRQAAHADMWTRPIGQP